MKKLLIRTAMAGILVVSTTMSAIAADKVVLSMWHNHPEWKDRVHAIIDKFEGKHPNIEIELQKIA